jgi:hypothetical protein
MVLRPFGADNLVRLHAYMRGGIHVRAQELLH